MSKEMYRLWRENDKMRRYRSAFEKDQEKAREKDRCVLNRFVIANSIVFGIFILFLFYIKQYTPESYKSVWTLSFSISFVWILYSASHIFTRDEELTRFFVKILRRQKEQSPAYQNWTRQHKRKNFGDAWIVQALDAGIPRDAAVTAMADFLSENDISYAAFDAYCKQKQTLIEQEEAAAVKKKQKEQRLEKEADRLYKKFPAAADAQS